MKRSVLVATVVGGLIVAAVVIIAFLHVGGARAGSRDHSGWFLAGSSPKDFDMIFDRAGAHGGRGCGSLRSKSVRPSGFGTMMQMFQAQKYQGQRVRLPAWVKSDRVTGWSGVWMRVDGARSKDPLAFDNMQERPIKGSTSWKRYQVVLDVAPQATNVAFGILLDGPGRVWIDDVQIEVVNKSVPTTGIASSGHYPAAPVNLDFER